MDDYTEDDFKAKAIRFDLWQRIHFSLNHPDFIANIKRQFNDLKDEDERADARQALRQSFSQFGISDEQMEQFFHQMEA